MPAIDHLEDFGSSDIILQGKAYALTGDAHMELGEIDEAISSYKQAADYKKNEFFTPTYLTKLAVAYEQNGDYQKAIDAYDKIIKEYYNSQETTNAKKQKGRLESLASN